MCGINGIFAYHYASSPIDRSELVRTRDHMAARGPDGTGLWVDATGRVGLGHRRLAIIDLSESGAQPMASADGAHVVTFNGEIYNYRELRRALEQKGHRFSSHSDTEVLLHLYTEKGARMVHDLRGMYAIAIWDSRHGSMFLARDPLGIKPLYYADDGWTFRFASQVKALKAGDAISNDLDPAGNVGFWLWGSVPEPFTTWLAIRSLPAGCHMTVDRLGAHEAVRYHCVAQVYCEAERQRSSAGGSCQEALRAALLDSVRHHLVADVPVGVFLSAGIDSGAILGLARDAGLAEMQAVTIAFEEFAGTPNDESALAALVAQRYGARHTTRIVTRAEFEAELPRFMAAMDQPTIDGLNTWLVSKAAAELGLKVSLSGLGGDELFGGYPSFRTIPAWVRTMSIPSRIPFLGKAFERGLSSLPARLAPLHPKTAGIVSMGGTYPGAYQLRRGLFMPWELERLRCGAFVREGLRRLHDAAQGRAALQPSPRSSHAKVAVLETQLYMRNQLLRDTDWASMAHGLEVRVPLVDATLLEAVAPIMVKRDHKPGKAALSTALSRPLPEAVVLRSKTGFSTPLSHWQAPVKSVRSQQVRGSPWARQWAHLVADAQGLAA